MRTFIALELPSQFRNETAFLASQLAGSVKGRFMKRDTYHLTLAFLGEIDTTTLNKTIEAINSTLYNSKPITLQVEGLGKFGKAHDATLYLQIREDEQLCLLSQTLRGKLIQQGISFDQKRFRPHITLARRAKIPKEAFDHLVFPEKSTATTVTLFKSILTQAGTQYKPLYSVELS